MWWNVRLPDNIVPDHYDVVLYIDLKKLVFFGDVSILMNVTKPTENVLVHVNKMNITQSPVVEKASSGGKLKVFFTVFDCMFLIVIEIICLCCPFFKYKIMQHINSLCMSYFWHPYFLTIKLRETSFP